MIRILQVLREKTTRNKTPVPRLRRSQNSVRRCSTRTWAPTPTKAGTKNSPQIEFAALPSLLTVLSPFFPTETLQQGAQVVRLSSLNKLLSLLFRLLGGTADLYRSEKSPSTTRQKMGVVGKREMNGGDRSVFQGQPVVLHQLVYFERRSSGLSCSS